MIFHHSFLPFLPHSSHSSSQFLGWLILRIVVDIISKVDPFLPTQCLVSIIVVLLKDQLSQFRIVLHFLLHADPRIFLTQHILILHSRQLPIPIAIILPEVLHHLLVVVANCTPHNQHSRQDPLHPHSFQVSIHLPPYSQICKQYKQEQANNIQPMKRELTDKEKNVMRKTVQKLLLPNGDVVAYCLGNKESGSGLFSNERLLLLHSGLNFITYYSKLPDGLPFTGAEHIPDGKEKVLLKEVQDFKCYPMKGKTSTLVMEWAKDKKWVYGMGSTKMMHEWISIVDDMLKGKIQKNPQGHLSQQQIPQQRIPQQQYPQQQPPQQISYQQPPQQQTQLVNLGQQNNTQNIPQASDTQIKPSPYAQKSPQQNGQNNSQQSPEQNLSNHPQQLNNPYHKTIPQPNSNKNIQNQSQQPNNNQGYSPLGNRQDQQQQPKSNKNYAEVSEEIKALKQDRPEKFNLTNQLSRKNLNNHPNQEYDTQPINMTSSNMYQQEELKGPSFEDSRRTEKDEPIRDEERNMFKKQERNMFKEQERNMFKEQERNMFKEEKRPEKRTNNRSLTHLSRSREPEPVGYTANNEYDNSRGVEDEDFQGGEGRQFDRMHSENPQNFSKYNREIDSRSEKPIKYTDSNEYHSPKESQSRVGAIKKEKQRKSVNQKARSQSKAPRKWNQTWCSAQQPLQIYQEFIQHCREVTQSIIDELPLLKNERQFIPFRYENDRHSYNYDGIIFDMHFFGTEDPSSFMNDSKNKEKVPLLFNQESLMESKREFYNYNFILAATGNKGLMKVPLSCLIDYKGVLMFCKAVIPDSFEKVAAHQYEKQIEGLEEIIKMRFIFSSIGLYIHPQGKYFLLWELEELIPRIPCSIDPPIYFRKEFLLENEIMIDDQQSLNDIYSRMLDENMPEFLTRMENLQGWIINSEDLSKQMHKSGLSMGLIPELHSRTNFTYLRRIFTSEMVSEIFSGILRSELNNVYNTIPDDMEGLTIETINQLVMDCTHVMVDELFSYSSRAESIWKAIVREINKKYGIIISKEDVLPGYLLGAIMSRNGIDCFYKTPELDREAQFFIKEHTIPRELFLRFVPKIRRYDFESSSNIMARIYDILSIEPTPENFEDLVHILDLRNSPLPPFCHPIKSEILAYMCNFIPLGQHEEFEQVGPYDLLQTEPHTYCSTKVSLLAIKWAVKKKNEDLANKIFQIKFEENAFWVSEFNPAISQFYDFFSIYNSSTGNFEEAVKLSKSSLVNSIKLLGANTLPTADKHYQLGNIFFKIGKKEEALKQYLKTKQILEDHRQTTIPEYGVILLKVALLYLNFGKISECVGSGLEALKIFDANGGSEQDQIETFEILARAYEITRKNGDMVSVGALCSQKFNQTEDIKIFSRMIKIVILPKLMALNPQDSKILLKMFIRLEELESPITPMEAFSFLHNKSLKHLIMKKVLAMIDNVSDIHAEISRKDLFRKHKSLNYDTNNQASEMLVLLEAIANLIGFGFVIGSLRDSYYN